MNEPEPATHTAFRNSIGDVLNQLQAFADSDDEECFCAFSGALLCLREFAHANHYRFSVALKESKERFAELHPELQPVLTGEVNPNN